MLYYPTLLFWDGITKHEPRDTKKSYKHRAGMPNETGVGTLAQKFQKIAPYMVKPWEYNNEKGVSETYLGIDYGPLTFVLVNAVQEQQKIIQTSKDENKALKDKVNSLEARLNRIEKMLKKASNY